jgi:hypothetical protein
MVASARLRANPRAFFVAAFQFVGLAVLLFAMICLYAYLRSGNIAYLLPYLNGQRVFVHPADVKFGQKAPNETIDLPVELSNRSARALTILGAQMQCSCVSTDTFPISVAPGRAHTLSIKVHLPASEGPFEQQIIFFTDHTDVSQFRVHVSGDVGQ